MLTKKEFMMFAQMITKTTQPNFSDNTRPLVDLTTVLEMLALMTEHNPRVTKTKIDDVLSNRYNYWIKFDDEPEPDGQDAKARTR